MGVVEKLRALRDSQEEDVRPQEKKGEGCEPKPILTRQLVVPALLVIAVLVGV